MKKTAIQKICHASLHFLFLQNNIILTLSTPKGDVLGWVSAGILKLKGTQKSTPFAALSILQKMLELINSFHIKSLDFYIKGLQYGNHLPIMLTTCEKAKVVILSIHEISGIPHNGCRLPNKRKL